MLSLMIDTSNRYLLIAMAKDGVLFDKIQEEGSRRQSENAIPYIERMLDQHGLELFDFDEIIVTQGPGSYTGVRVGLTIAKTLKAVSPVEVKMVSSLAAFAGTEGKKIALIDARSQKVFVGVYNQGVLQGSEQMVAISDFDAFKAKYPDYDIVGDGALVNVACQEVDLASHMLALGKITTPVGSVHELLPRYIKDVEAKIQWQPSEA